MSLSRVALDTGLDESDVVGVRGCPGFYVTRSGNVYSHREGRSKTVRIVPSVGRSNYLIVAYAVTSGGVKYVNKTVALHRLLAEAFLPDFQENLLVRHLDGNIRSNAISNLAVGTAVDNMTDLIGGGGKAGGQVLTLEAVKQLKAMLASGRRIVDIARHFSLSPSTVSNIAAGRRWAINFEEEFSASLLAASNRSS